jgi:hypothetical protein
LFAIGPKIGEVAKIARTLELQPRNRAMHGDLVPGNIFENPFIGGGRAPRVVFRLQAIDRHNYVETTNALPLGWDRADSTGDELHFNLHFSEFGEQNAQLVVTH